MGTLAFAVGHQFRAVGHRAVDLLAETFGGRHRGQRGQSLRGRQHLLGELGQELVVDVGGDDEAFGRIAGLAGVLETPGDGRIDSRIEVVGAQHDERVTAAELEYDLLQVAPGDFGHRRAGPLRAGQRHSLNSRVGDRLGDLLVGGVDVDVGALREAGIVVDFLDGRGRLRALRCVLEHDRVAQCQVRAGEPGHLVVRVVPRHDAQQHTHRAAPDDGAALAVEQVDRFIGKELLGVIGVVLVDRRAEVDLAECAVDLLAHLAVDDFGELLPTLGVQRGDLADERCPLGDRGVLGPLPVSLLGRCQGILDLLVGCRRVLLHHVSGCRVHHCIETHSYVLGSGFGWISKAVIHPGSQATNRRLCVQIAKSSRITIWPQSR